MLIIRLKYAIERYKKNTGEKLTYQMLADRTGISLDTLQSLATRQSYNTTLSTVEKLCNALQCSPGELLTIAEEDHKNGNQV